MQNARKQVHIDGTKNTATPVDCAVSTNRHENQLYYFEFRVESTTVGKVLHE